MAVVGACGIIAGFSDGFSGKQLAGKGWGFGQMEAGGIGIQWVGGRGDVGVIGTDFARFG